MPSIILSGQKKTGTNAPAIIFPNEGTPREGLLEFPILSSPQGADIWAEIDGMKNPDRVVFRLEEDNTVTFMGVMSHAGNNHQHYKTREFVVYLFFY